MKKALTFIFVAGVAAACCVAAAKKTARIERDLRLLDKRADDLEDAVELLDTRTDGMEYDMKYNVKRMDNFERYDIDIDINDDDY